MAAVMQRGYTLRIDLVHRVLERFLEALRRDGALRKGLDAVHVAHLARCALQIEIRFSAPSSVARSTLEYDTEALATFTERPSARASEAMASSAVRAMAAAADVTRTEIRRNAKESKEFWSHG